MRCQLVSPCASPVRHAAPAGVEAVVYALAEGLARRGHRVRVVAAAGSVLPEGVALDVATHPTLPEILPRLLKAHPDALICDHSGARFEEGADAPRFLRVFHVAPQYIYAPPPSPRCAFVSGFLRGAFAEALDPGYGRCPVLHNGLLAAPDWGAGAGPVGDDVVFIGRLNRLKGIDLAAAACQRVGLRLHVYGGLGREAPADIVFNDLPFLDALEARFGEALEYHGPLWDHTAKGERIAAARALVIPSREPETCALVALEAAALGAPVVALRHGGIVEYAPERVTFVDPGGDDEARIAGLARALEATSGAPRQRGLPARLSAEAMVGRYLEWWGRLGWA